MYSMIDEVRVYNKVHHPLSSMTWLLYELCSRCQA